MTQPTFDRRLDYLVYLLAEFKVLVSLLLLGAGVFVVYVSPDLPTLPPWVGAVSVVWMLLGIPCWLLGRQIAEWLRNRNWVEVHEINALTDDVEKWHVAPEVWAEKRVEGPDPWPVNGGAAWATRQFEWFEETDTLAVEGVYFSELSDDKLYTSKAHVEDIQEELPELKMRLSQLRARVSSMAADIQSDTINTGAEARERGILLDRDAAKSAWEDAQDGDLLDEDELSGLKENVDLDEYTDLSPGSDDEIPADVTEPNGGSHG
jgi:hypothetical protein